MADMKVFKIEADTKGAVKNLKEVEIQTVKAISAQEILQGLLTSPEPLKNMEKYIPVYKRIGDITESISKMIPASVKQMQEAQIIVDKGIAKQLEGSKKISEANKKELDDIKKKVQTTDEQNERLRKEKERLLSGLEKAEKEHNEGLVADYKEALKNIEKLEKEQNGIEEQQSQKRREIIRNTFEDMRKASDDAYAQSTNSIKLKYDLEAQEIRNSCDLTLAAENEKAGIKRASAENEQAMMVAQNIKLKDLEERRNAELKKAEQEHQKANSAIVENYLKERSANLTVHVDTTTQKIEKNTKKTLDGLGDIFKDADQETMDFITKQAVETQKASEKAAETAKKEASATKEATAATKEAADATKKYVDIQQTRGKLTGHIKELEDAKQVYQDRIKLYDLEIINAGENLEKQKELEKQKADYIKQNAADIIKIHQHLTAAEKQQQDLSMLQWTQYAQKAGEVANSIKDVTGKVGDYLSTAFTAVSSVYKAEIAAIDEEIKQFKVRQDENAKEHTASTALTKKLEDDLNQAKITGNQDAINSIQDRIDAEKELTKSLTIEQNKLANEEAQLNEKKAKKQKEQEKIEKLNRKATLIKNIGEATSNVAQGVTKALSYGPFLGPVLAAIVAAAGAVQIGIMTKQLVKFADGGLLNGKRHSQGGMRIEGSNIEVEGGEYVVNRESTSKNLGLVRYINSERRELKPTDIESFFARSSQGFEPSFRRMFEDGGQLPAVDPNSSIDNEALIYAIKNIRIEPRVAVTDIHKVQDTMVSVDGWTGV